MLAGLRAVDSPPCASQFPLASRQPSSVTAQVKQAAAVRSQKRADAKRAGTEKRKAVSSLLAVLPACAHLCYCACTWSLHPKIGAITLHRVSSGALPKV